MTYPQYPQSEYGAQAPATSTYATWIQRVAAALIDAIPGIILSLIAFIVDRPTVDLATGEQSGGGVVYYSLSLLGFLIGAYNRWYLGGTTGQSWGKKVVGLKLVKEATGQPIGFGMAFVRDLLHIVDSICFIGYLFPLWDAKKQTIADKLVKTLVIK